MSKIDSRCQGECYCESSCECEEETQAYMDEWETSFSYKNNRDATPEESRAEEETLGGCRYCNGLKGAHNTGSGDVRHCNFCENGCDCYYCTEEKVWQNGDRDPRRALNAWNYFPDNGGEVTYNKGTSKPRSGNGLA